QRLCEKKRALPLPKPLPVILILVSIAFFAWRLITVSAIAVPTNQAWLLDKWHLGPLRLLNFLVTGWAFSKVLGHLQCWETVLHPFSLIGRNMLPVFCSQIGLSMLLIGIIPFFRGAEPVSSILVICQLLTAFLFARFVEWLTQKKKLLGESTEHFAANHRTLANVQTPALSAWMNQWSAFAAATKVERLSTPVAPASVTPASLSLASAPRRHLPFPGAGQVSKWKCGNFAGTP
ncbi:MAG TPA: OpgC domain-containing protein, partial [Chthoniobacterales bacterium]|nr:OpgC domain-containing protein [Chthoniobacterales bacterium]